MLLPVLILLCAGYLLYTGVELFSRKKHPAPLGEDRTAAAFRFILAGGVPVLVAVVMAWLFIFSGAATTVQFNAGSSSRMNAWSTWVGIWRLFLFLSEMSLLGNLIWLLLSLSSKPKRRAMGFIVFTLFLSILTFFTVASYFPSS